MNENGLWSLFWETGLPEAYLMLAALDREGPGTAGQAVVSASAQGGGPGIVLRLCPGT